MAAKAGDGRGEPWAQEGLLALRQAVQQGARFGHDGRGGRKRHDTVFSVRPFSKDSQRASSRCVMYLQIAPSGVHSLAKSRFFKKAGTFRLCVRPRMW